MREILFRGKASFDGRDGEWVYGGLLPETENTFPIIVRDYDNDEDWIGVNGWDTVYPETVGQYTGLTDKNGKKIFEGDIVKHYNNSDDGFDVGMLYWDETFSQWKRTSIGNFHHRSFTYSMSRSCDYEVIGNIHDNPELLEGGAE